MRQHLSKRIALALIVVTVCALASSCLKAAPALKYFTFNSEIRGGAPVIKELHISSPAKGSVAVSDGHLDLLYDEKNSAVSVYDGYADTYWTSLPVFENNNSAVLSATLVSENGRYYLNSQDNAVAFSAFDVRFSENGLCVTYFMSDSKEAALSGGENLTPGEVYAAIPVSYALSDGKLTVSVNCADIVISPGFVLEKLSLLPYFGALYHFGAGDSEIPAVNTDGEPSDGETTRVIVIEEDQTRDFLLAPDGPGALIFPDASDGADMYYFSLTDSGKSDVSALASAGFFGIGKEGASFVGLITEGAALAGVRAQKSASNSDGVNIVYPEFSVTPSTLSGDKYYYSDPFTGNITVIYRFLSAPVCSYIDMAAACREELIRCGMLKSSTVRENSYPLNVSVISSVNGKESTTVTDFSQVEDLTTVLKGKGISDINLALYGIFRDGIFQDSASGIKVLHSSGGRRGFKHLCEYLASQNIPLYVGIDLFYSGSRQNSLITADGSRAAVYKENPLAPLGTYGESKYVLPADQVEENLIRIMTALKNYDFPGFAVADGNFSVNAGDFSYAQTFRDSVLALSAKNKVLLSAPFFETIGNADVITDLPLETSFPESDGYECVPFLPAVLHSVVTFSGEAIRGDEVYMLRLLKCVEYGAAPHVLWVFDENSPYYYEKTMTDVSDFTVRVGEDIADLSSQPMESHKKLQEGVYRTGFSGGSVIYVNYNNYSVNIGNISIPPYDYIRIG